MTAVLALSLSSEIEKYGAYAGFAAVVGLGVLSLLYFAQAREVKRLREWAGRAPERDADVQQRVIQEAQRRAAAPGPRPQPARPTAPATPAAAAAAAAAVAQPAATHPTHPGSPTGPRPPVPATAAAVAAKAAPAATPSGTPPAPLVPAPGTPPAAPGTPPVAPVPAPAGGATEAPAQVPAAEPQAPAPGQTPPAAPKSAPVPVVPGTQDAPATPGVPKQPAVAAAAANPATATPASKAEAPVPSAAPVPAPVPATAAARPAEQPPAPPRPRPRPAVTRGADLPPRPPAPEGSHRGLVGVIAGGIAIAAVAVLLITQVFGGDDTSPGRPNTVGTPTTDSAGQPVAESKPQPKRDTTRVAVFNGTAVNGLARAAADKLTAAGYKNVSPVQTDKTNQARATTAVYWQSGSRREGVDTARIIGVAKSALVAMDQNARVLSDGAPVVVFIGADQAQ